MSDQESGEVASTSQSFFSSAPSLPPSLPSFFHYLPPSSIGGAEGSTTSTPTGSESGREEAEEGGRQAAKVIGTASSSA
jgi:hypothetical protein